MGGQVIARSSPVVEVLSRTPVAPKNHVLLLRVGQRVLVVGDSGGGLRTLANLDDPEEVASVLQAVTAQGDASVSRSFNSLVSRFQQAPETAAADDPLAGPGAMPRFVEEGGDTQEFSLDRTRDALSGLASRLRSLSEPRGAP